MTAPEAAPTATGQAVLVAATRQLAQADVPNAAGDALALMSFALGDPPRHTLRPMLVDPLPADAAARFAAALSARLSRQPVSQITGRRAFWTQTFVVTPDTLDPRPETEALVALALEAPFGTVLDLGTGTGCILLSLLGERIGATGIGTDMSDAALAVAQANADRLGLTGRATFTRSDWFDGVAGTYDLIVSNPPYIAEAEMPALAPEVREWEPHAALTPGGDGLAAYRAIGAAAHAHLVPGGRLLVEIGPTQAADVRAALAAGGLEDITVHADLDGRDRVIRAIRAN